MHVYDCIGIGMKAIFGINLRRLAASIRFGETYSKMTFCGNLLNIFDVGIKINVNMFYFPVYYLIYYWTSTYYVISETNLVLGFFVKNKISCISFMECKKI